MEATRLLKDLTVGEFRELLREVQSLNINYVKGIKGLCTIMQCSRATAWKYLKEGYFDGAYFKIKNSYYFDKNRVFEIIKNKNKTA